MKCDASGAIANGALGPECSSTLAIGSSCAPTCDAGYVSSGDRPLLVRSAIYLSRMVPERSLIFEDADEEDEEDDADD